MRHQETAGDASTYHMHVCSTCAEGGRHAGPLLAWRRERQDSREGLLVSEGVACFDVVFRVEDER